MKEVLLNLFVGLVFVVIIVILFLIILSLVKFGGWVGVGLIILGVIYIIGGFIRMFGKVG